MEAVKEANVFSSLSVRKIAKSMLRIIVSLWSLNSLLKLLGNFLNSSANGYFRKARNSFCNS